MRRQTRNEVLQQHQHEGADRRAEQRPHPAEDDDDQHHQQIDRHSGNLRQQDLAKGVGEADQQRRRHRTPERADAADHDDDKGDAAKAAPEAKTKPCTSRTSTSSAWVISRLAAPARIIMPSLVLWITRYIAAAIKRQEPETTRR